MKKSILFILVACLLCACNGSQSSLDPTQNGGGGGSQDSLKNALKIIEANYYGEQQEDLHYVSMRFVTSNVGYVTNADSTVTVAGTGAIIDLLLVASSLDENKVPVAGTYNVNGVDAALTALNTRRIFDGTTVNPAVYKVSDGEVGEAIAYTSGSVTVTRLANKYKMTISLACSDGFTRTYSYSGQITVIDKTQPAVQVTSIAFAEQGPLEMTTYETKTLHIEFTPSNATDNVQFTVSDPSKIQITNTSNTTCELFAVEKANNVIITATCAHSGCYATIAINVVTSSEKNFQFYDIYAMAETDEMPEERYCIYRLRIYRGTDIPNGGDAQLTKVIDNTKRFPDPGTWLYRRDTLDSSGEVCQLGIFRDSILSQRAWMLSSDAYFDGDGDFTVDADALIMEFKMVFMFDYKYHYSLGDYTIVSDPTVTDTIRPVGVAAKPMPGYIQATRFNESGYLSFFADWFDENQGDFEDYDVFGDGDARLKPVYSYIDEGTGETGVGILYFFGSVNSGVITIGVNDATRFYGADYYDINATVYDNAFTAYCLKTTTDIDPETGNESVRCVEPLQMANSQNVNYTGGSPSYARRCERPVPAKGFQKRMKVNRTMGAVLHSYLFSTRKIWRNPGF